MIKTIQQVIDQLNEVGLNQYGYEALSLWAKEIINECADKAEAHPGIGYWSEDVYLDGSPEVSRESILAVKEQLK